MKKNYWPKMCVLLLALAACDSNDEVPDPNRDTVAPQITITSPIADDTYLAIGLVIIRATATDGEGIKEMRLFLEDRAGKRIPIDVQDDGREITAKERNINQVIQPGVAASGLYKLVVEAEDHYQNVSSRSVEINLITEDLAQLNFYTAFTTTGWFELADGNQDDLNLSDFNLAFYTILNRNSWDYNIEPDFVNTFGMDFGGHLQLWTTLDTNKNEYLEYSEFEQGMEDLNFFERWDIDKNELISENELTDGVGALWDENNDKEVTADEFKEKIMKYFLP
ncbi:Ig-like domain-containing protein [Pontibacter sp. Tf4]|uniref:Ig-like domain-containing protein n=1 Tax=Pontibacter sp. Tf4 TaxID=2761620 RepID=UPI001624B5BF|nr:Ig-like domain-containing protein [Pontibacter sp. Tf4]MBB6612401.1 Ig-like domain-containing protein [Pontibacter sp. Tf4]